MHLLLHQLEIPKQTFYMLNKGLERLTLGLCNLIPVKPNTYCFPKSCKNEHTQQYVYLGGQKLKQVIEHCQLGLLLVFHESFNWDAHIKQAIEKPQ